jgi:hypothetical protein
LRRFATTDGVVASPKGVLIPVLARPQSPFRGSFATTSWREGRVRKQNLWPVGFTSFLWPRRAV